MKKRTVYLRRRTVDGNAEFFLRKMVNILEDHDIHTGKYTPEPNARQLTLNVGCEVPFVDIVELVKDTDVTVILEAE